jgi:hypothetical protein
MSKFKIGDEIIKKFGIYMTGQIVDQDDNTNYIIFPGAGNILIDYNDNEIEKYLGNCKGTYYSMIQNEKKYWNTINKKEVEKLPIRLKDEFSTSQNILKSPTLLNGLVINNGFCFEFTKYNIPLYLDHYIDDNDIVWVKIFFSENRIVGWIQSYKIKFVNRIFTDLIYSK